MCFAEYCLFYRALLQKRPLERRWLVCVIWRIYMCGMPRSYLWHDPFARVTSIIHAFPPTMEKTLIGMVDTMFAYVRHDMFICVAWLIRTCDMTLSCVTEFPPTWKRSICVCVTWLILTYTPDSRWLRNKRRLVCVTQLITHICDMTRLYVWHDSVVRVTWLVYESPSSRQRRDVFCMETTSNGMFDTTYAHMWHDSVICWTWLTRSCDVTRLRVTEFPPTMGKTSNGVLDTTDAHLWHASFICWTWLTRTCDVTRLRVTEFPPTMGKTSNGVLDAHLWHDSLYLTWWFRWCEMTFSDVT